MGIDHTDDLSRIDHTDDLSEVRSCECNKTELPVCFVAVHSFQKGFSVGFRTQRNRFSYTAQDTTTLDNALTLKKTSPGVLL